MKKILILSGKGGTGKTTISSAFIEFSKTNFFADCDVDAPNLHLIVDLEKEPKKREFYGLPKAKINKEKCIECGKCKELCKFNAVKHINNKYIIDQYACEGCQVCKLKCPTNAIEIEDDISGDLMIYEEDKIFSTAKLKMGRGNSGKLVTEVKEQLYRNVDKFKNNEENEYNKNKLNIKENKEKLKFNNLQNKISIIDGSPGIGCPVIASISGVDFVLIVAEPSLSGISDMKRIIETVKKFRIKLAVCVNKYDICIENTKKIEEYCKDNNIKFVGKISYDPNIQKNINEGKNITQTKSISKKEVIEIYNNVINLLRC